jgi:hypothetical protein
MFQKLLKIAGIGTTHNGHRPRLHELRHNSEATIIPSVTSLGVGLPALRCEEAVPVPGIIRGSSGIA